MAATIHAHKLAKSYGDVTAVDGVSFEVSEGEIFGYLGRNGSGKTTTVRMLTTLARPTSGTGRVAGHDIVKDAAAVKSSIGVTMQEAALDPQMTGSAHLRFIAGILGHTAKNSTVRSDDMLERFGLTEAANRSIGTYSGGMKRRLDLATALLGEPKVLFLDEPTTGLDPQSRRALWSEIMRLKSIGATIFLTTQYLEEADQLADHLAIIDRGKIIAQGTTAALKTEHGRKKITVAADGTTDGLVDRLATNPDYQVVADGGHLRIETRSDIGDRELLAFLTELTHESNGSGGLEIVDTSLEDVFLRLTGADINDSPVVATP